MSEAAADAFTLGQYYLATVSDDEGYDRAIEAFTEAIDERPTFARAYFQRGLAYSARGTQSVGGGFSSNVEDEFLDKQIDDEQKALDLGLREPTLLNNLAFDTYVRWLRSGDGRPPAQSIELLREAAERDPEDPVTILNLALLLLADGQMEEADAMYETGIDRILYTGVTGNVPRGARTSARPSGSPARSPTSTTWRSATRRRTSPRSGRRRWP